MPNIKTRRGGEGASPGGGGEFMSRDRSPSARSVFLQDAGLAVTS